MNRRGRRERRGIPMDYFLCALSVLCGSLFSTVRAAAAPDDRPPNVVFVITDDQGWFDVGVNGNPHIDTPNMDRLAGEGVRFTHFYATPVCTPTRAGLITGRYFQRTGAIDTYMGRDTLAADEVTVAEVFKQRGYRTGIFGKWHLGRYARYHPNSRGFDEFFGFWQYGFINRYMDSDELWHNRRPVATVGYVTDVLTDQAIDFVRRNKARPFFCYVPYNAPHDPHLVDDRWIDKYLKRGLPLRQARIYGMVDVIDQNLGRLLKAIDDEGLRENTVVVFMTDNGGVSTYHKCGLRGNKGSVYEGGVRVPLFVRWPGKFPAGATVNAMAQYVDLFPTLCEIIGAPLPAGREIDGKTLLPLLKAGGGESPHEYLFHQWTRVRPEADKNWAVRDRRYKLVNGELFDLQADPGESKNIAADHPDVVKRLRGEFERWFADVTGGRDYARVPIEVGRADENPVELDVTWAETAGAAKRVKPSYNRYIRDHVTDWTDAGDSIRFAIDVTRPGNYEVRLSYGSHPADAGSAFRVSVGDAHVDAKVRATAGREVFRPQRVGTLRLDRPGPATLEIKPLDLKGRELMVLHKVWLRRVGDAP